VTNQLGASATTLLLQWKDTQNLIGDVGLIVVAGSDTTATTLTCLFYQLALHPEALARLRDEVDALVADKGGDVALLDNAALTKLDYLQACIDESLRLNPVVPMGVQRKTPPEGAQLGARWVPGDITVVMPSWIMYRGGSYYFFSFSTIPSLFFFFFFFS
jgi:cytochrome P450 family 628